MKKYDARRRNFMKTSIAGAAIGTLGLLSGRAGHRSLRRGIDRR